MRSIRARRLAALLGAAAISAVAPATAVPGQAPTSATPALGGIPLPPSPPTPPATGAATGPASVAPATAATEVLDAAGPSTLALRPFVRHARGADWVGLVREQDAVRATFDVPGFADLDAAHLDLRLRNGADVLATGSVLSVLVNGERVGEIRPDAISEPKDVRLALDPELLVSRGNDLSIRAEHAHRVSCTETGSFELDRKSVV